MISRFDLATYGFPNQYVDLRDPKFMPWGDLKRLLREWQAITNNPADNTEYGAEERFILDRVASWMILNPKTGQPIGEPSAETLELVPVGIVAPLMKEIGRLLSEATSVPKA